MGRREAGLEGLLEDVISELGTSGGVLQVRVGGGKSNLLSKSLGVREKLMHLSLSLVQRGRGDRLAVSASQEPGSSVVKSASFPRAMGSHRSV